MAASISDTRPLQYKGEIYPNYWIAPCGTLFIQFKRGFKRKTLHPRDDYMGYNITNPRTGKSKWIQFHLAVQHSFHPDSDPDLLGCHNHGTKKRMVVSIRAN
jgi:hypothetical protein